MVCILLFGNIDFMKRANDSLNRVIESLSLEEELG